MVLSVLVLAGCAGEEHEDLKAWMRDSTKDLKGRVLPLPEMKPFQQIDYDVGNLVSPFDPKKIVPDKTASGGGGIKPDMNRRREPLEAYPLESLKMVGSISRRTNTIAIVQADKTVHHVRTGNYLGQNFGVITSISEGELTLKELVQDSNGDWEERSSSLQLQEQSQEK